MEVPLALFQHHQKESGFPAGGAQGGWRRSGGGTFIFLQDFDFKHLCDNWREGPTGKKPLTSRCCPDGKNQVSIESESESRQSVESSRPCFLVFK